MTPPASSPFTPDEQLLDRYLAGVASADERAAIAAWLRERPAMADVVQVLERAELAGPVPQASSDVEADWTALQGRLRVSDNRPAVRAPHSRFRIYARWAGAAAAVVLLTLGVRNDWFSSGPSPDKVTITYQTAYGQQKAIGLLDGSLLVLGPGSTARVKGRDAVLVGEAAFRVNGKDGHPFTVRAGRSLMTVLGTTFDVRAYPTDGAVRVAVFDGKVRLTNGQSAVQVLAKGEVGRVFADGHQTVEQDQNVNKYGTWTQGRLEFSNTPMLDVVADLARWYDVDIRVATPSLANDHFTASFYREPLDYVLNTMSVTLGARVERHGRVIILTR